MSNEEKLIESKTEKSDLVVPTPHKELMAIFDPPTELPVESFEKCSFVDNRKWAGKRAAEIVEKKYGGFNQVTDEQLSQSHKQAWNERVMACKAVKVLNSKALAETELESGNHDLKKTADSIKNFVEKKLLKTEPTEKPEGKKPEKAI